MTDRPMQFNEAMTRARIEHTPIRTVHQPGHQYRREHICKCGAYVFAYDWNQHVLNAADRLMEDENS